MASVEARVRSPQKIFKDKFEDALRVNPFDRKASIAALYPEEAFYGEMVEYHEALVLRILDYWTPVKHTGYRPHPDVLFAVLIEFGKEALSTLEESLTNVPRDLIEYGVKESLVRLRGNIIDSNGRRRNTRPDREQFKRAFDQAMGFRSKTGMSLR